MKLYCVSSGIQRRILPLNPDVPSLLSELEEANSCCGKNPRGSKVPEAEAEVGSGRFEGLKSPCIPLMRTTSYSTLHFQKQ